MSARQRVIDLRIPIQSRQPAVGSFIHAAYLPELRNHCPELSTVVFLSSWWRVSWQLESHSRMFRLVSKCECSAVTLNSFLTVKRHLGHETHRHFRFIARLKAVLYLSKFTRIRSFSSLVNGHFSLPSPLIFPMEIRAFSSLSITWN